MAGRRPYFPLYVNDFAADPVVEAMTTEQVGAYILLLCKAWAEKPQGSIPMDDPTLARWTRLKPKRWAAIKAGVLAAFKPGPDSRLTQKRMVEEAAKLAARSDSARESINKRWAYERITNEEKTNGVRNTRASASVSESVSSSSSEEGGGVGAGEPPEFDLTPAGLAGEWCFSYRGSASSHRDPYKIAAEFEEWIENLGVSAESIRAAIQAKRDRSEPPWNLKERIAKTKKPRKDGSAALAAAMGETDE